jgi:O-antigen ligase
MTNEIRSHSWISRVQPEWVAFGFMVILLPLIIVNAPGLIYPFIALPFVALVAYFVFKDKKNILYTTLLSSIFVVYNSSGLDIGELGYYALWAATFSFVLIPHLFSARLKIENVLDKYYILFFISVLVALFVGLAFSSTGVEPLIEVLYFYSGILFYFAIRPHLDDKYFRIGLFAVFFFIFLYVILRTYLSYRTAILNAVQEWELNFARGAGNENFLLIGIILVTATLLYAQKTWHKASLVVLFVLTVGAIVVTLTRSLWVTSVLGILIVGFFVGKAQRKRLIGYVGVAGVIGFIVALIYWDVTLFIFELLVIRFQSFSQGLQDISVTDRIYETQRVWNMITQNPILGWGYGTEFQKYDVLFRRTSSFTSYIHNGYLAIWFKNGIVGLFAILAYIVTLFIYAFKIYRKTQLVTIKILMITILAYIPTAGLMNVTSPVVYSYEGVLLLIILGSVVSWYSVRQDQFETNTLEIKLLKPSSR